MGKKVWFALIGGAVIGIGLSFIGAVMVDKTGQPEFCTKCHEMKPMGETFKFSVHGGNNPVGFAAHHCTDCHLPHDSLIGYLWHKGMSGMRDGLAHAGTIHKVDFKENFWRMDEYVYDSACLKCHEGIKNIDEESGLAENIKYIHKEFYWKPKEAGEEVSCTKCHNDYTHPNFAHPNLLEALDNSTGE